MAKIRDKIGKGAKRVGKAGWDVGKEAAGEIIGKTVAPKIGQKATERILGDQKGELLKDLLNFLGEDSKLLKRLKKAVRNHTDDRLINLLCKIPQQYRQEIFAKFEEVDDKTFDFYMEILAHNPLAQFFQRIEKRMKRKIIQKKNGIIQGLGGTIEQINKDVEESGLLAWSKRFRDNAQKWAEEQTKEGRKK